MLWTDGDFVTSAHLILLDAEVGEVASVEGITLDGSAGIIHRAIDEAGGTLLSHAQQFGGAIYNGSVSSGHYAAVMNTGLPAVNRVMFLLSQVVTSGFGVANTFSPLMTWVAYRALVMFFRDAANRTLKDRYETKQERYHKWLNTVAWQAVLAQGAPLVNQPLPAPGALYELNTGTWSAANATPVTGPGTLTTSVSVVITWVQGNLATNFESAPSAPQAITMAAGNVLQVSITSLKPPNGAQPPATLPMGTMAYGTATAWNVYVDTADGAGLTLQAQVPIGTAVWALPGDPTRHGAVVGMGQYPELYYSFTNSLQRG